MRGLYRASVEKISELEPQVKEVRNYRDLSDKACSELSRIKAKHAEDVKGMQSYFDKRWNHLKSCHAEEKEAWDKKFKEEERRCRLQQRQLADQDKSLADQNDRLKWQHEKIARLTGDLDRSRRDVEDNQSLIRSLEEDLHQSEEVKLQARGRVQELEERMVRLEEEKRRTEAGMKEQIEVLNAELAAVHRRICECEGRLAEANTQISLAVKNYKSSAEFTKDQREACADAFRLGEEEARAKISQRYPELDLFFLDAEQYDARTPGGEEAEYEDISDVDLDAILGSEAPRESIQSAAEGSEAAARTTLGTDGAERTPP